MQSTPPRAWQRMLSGRRLDLLEPSALDVEIEDIAQGLSRVARWNGQTIGENAFSVAQHSIVVLEIYRSIIKTPSAQNQLICLLHDAPEYVVGDMISPFKAVVGGDYKSVEDRLLGAIHQRFSLPIKIAAELKKRIKKADTIAAYFEATQLAGFSGEEALNYFGSPQNIKAEQLPLKAWPAKIAQEKFLEYFNSIEKMRT